MRLFFLTLLPLLLAAAAATGGYTIEDIAKLTSALETETHLCTTDLSASSTLASVTDERIRKVKVDYLRNVHLYNAQQMAQIRSYAAQVKGLQHQLDDVVASLASSAEIAGKLTQNIDATVELVEHYKEITEDQLNDCKALADEYWQIRHSFLWELDSALGYLGGEFDVAKMELHVLEDFVHNRKCEHLSGYLDPEGGKVYIYFKTQFRTAPNLSASVTGFYADLDDLDVYSTSQSYDGISIMKDVYEISEYGFYLYTPDVSGGKVQVQAVYCNIMACEGINDMVDVTEGQEEDTGPVTKIPPPFTPPADVTLNLLEMALGQGGTSGL